VVSWSYLGVSDEDDLRAGALLVVGIHGLDNGGSTLRSRVVVADTATASLTAAGWVHDGFSTGSSVGSFDLVHEASTRPESVVLRHAGFTGTENINFGAAVTLQQFDGTGGDKAREESCCRSEFHRGNWGSVVSVLIDGVVM